jgi:hypothetical protein
MNAVVGRFSVISQHVLDLREIADDLVLPQALAHPSSLLSGSVSTLGDRCSISTASSISRWPFARANFKLFYNT